MSKKKGPKTSTKKRKLALDQPWEITEEIVFQHFENEEESHLCFVKKDEPKETFSSPETSNCSIVDEDLDSYSFGNITPWGGSSPMMTPSMPPILITELVYYFRHVYTELPIVDLADDFSCLLEGLRLANITHKFKIARDSVSKAALMSQIQQVLMQRVSSTNDNVTIDSVCDSIFLHMAMAALDNSNKAMVYLSEAHTYFKLMVSCYNDISHNAPRRKRVNCVLTNMRHEAGAHHLSSDPPNYMLLELMPAPYTGHLAHICLESYNYQVISLLLWHTSITMGQEHKAPATSECVTMEPQQRVAMDCHVAKIAIQQYLQLLQRPESSQQDIMKFGELLNNRLGLLSSSQLYVCGTFTLKAIIDILRKYPVLEHLAGQLKTHIDKCEIWDFSIDWLDLPQWENLHLPPYLKG
ncbi:hypothetical protein CJU90_6553 [Yarrowia sp. C11]|nr:hypothetical protein CJU90_6553 [Yarrowia sp. C11]KAG5371253.1 hypothetical protein CKK34_1393 [Yarrowia sp. E02]